MSNTSEYKDIIAFHPGYYISDIIEEMNINHAEFATRLGTTTKTVSLLLNGQANITNDLAKKLAVMMGTSSEVWLNLQSTYDQKLIEIQQKKDFDEQVDIVKQIDYEYFEDVAKLPKTNEVREKIENLCSWLKVSDLRIMLKEDFLINYRLGISNVNEKNIINSKAWVQTAINLSNSIKTKPYDQNKLKSYLPEIINMNVQEPEQFFPRMKEIFSECGVAFVLLPYLKNSGINGAVKWINGERVVLAMNNRTLYADTFWYSLLHEIKHVFQKKIKTVFIRYSEIEMKEINNKLEDEADEFASNSLIDPSDYARFAPTIFTTDNEIIAFAKSINRHPGIVAGRLQHDGILPPSRCSKFKKKYNIKFTYTM